jgi:hypothetical protein
MNEQLQSKLVEILSSIQSATKAGADFALEQLPDIAQQYVMYGRVSTTVSVALLLLALTACALACLWAVRQSSKSYSDQSGALIPVAMVSPVLGLFSALALLSYLNSCMLVWFAPKVWLLKELATIIK